MESTSIVIQAVFTILFTIIDHGSDIALAFRYYEDTIKTNNTISDEYEYMYDVYMYGEQHIDTTNMIGDPNIAGQVVFILCFS